MARFYVIDGNSLFFRAFFATYIPGRETMHTKSGIPTNALYSFANMITKIHEELDEDDKMVVCFDTGHKTFRSQELDTYKSQRKPAPEELKFQIPLGHQMLDAMGIARAEMEGYEGDDVAGSLATLGAKEGYEVTLFTSDKDFFQLIDDHISVRCLKKGLSDVIEYTKENIVEKFGCRADQIVDFKAIAGDASDNYKGIPGIGEKTAFSLLATYNHLEDILEAYVGDEKTSVGRKINAGADEGRKCKHIATILTDLDVSEFFANGSWRNIDFKNARTFFKTYELRSMITTMDKIESKTKKEKADSQQMSLFADTIEENTSKDFDYPKASRIKDLTEVEGMLISVSVVLDGKLDDANENTSDILGFIISTDRGTIYFIDKESAIKSEGFANWLSSNEPKRSLDTKALYVCTHRLGLKCGEFDYDFMLASYLCNSNKAASLKDALGQLDIEIEKDPLDRIAQATFAMDKHHESMISRLSDEGQMNLLTDVELPLSRTLADMEIEGMPIDLDTLKRIGDEYKDTLASIDERIMSYVDDPNFNINAPRQVERLLFETLGIQRDKNEKGATSDILTKHIEDHPIVPLILEHRTYSKIISGYVDSLPRHVSSDGKIHAMINQTLTTTGRLSMSEPNLQNISIRKEEGKELRKAFFYDDPDYEFLSFDYSQIELRVMASLGNIKGLKEVCSQGDDIHTATAAKVFNIPTSQVASDMRRVAKTVNFGIVYGISAFGLSSRLGCSRTQAKEFIDQFKTAFAGIEEYQAKEIEMAKEKGYVTTILNRRRYFPDINSPSSILRKFSERAAVNASIQGSAADLIKVAMNKVQEYLKGRKSKMILQIHDELIFKVHKDEKEELMKSIPDIMDGSLCDLLDVKLQVEGDYGHSWYDCK